MPGPKAAEIQVMPKFCGATRYQAGIVLAVATAFTALIALSSSLDTFAATPDRSVFLTDRMPYDAFDQLPQTRLRSGEAELVVAFAPGPMDLDQERLRAWIKRRADMVAGYYGRFPASTSRILVIPVSGSGVRSGTAYGWRGSALKVYVGESTIEGELEEDWILVHEMVHFAFPSLNDAHTWMGEGQATYIETVARVQAGNMSEAAVWWQFVNYMPKGLPRAGDRGLDYTHTWGRTYWGGAVFCLYADVQIRKRTGNRHGLQDALSAVVAAGGVNTETWPLRQALRIGDQVTGVKVLEELYDELRAAPGSIDLDQLWSDLGVKIGSSSVTFDDRAPLAAVRRAIMQPAAPVR
jgi:hypothetical protein